MSLEEARAVVDAAYADLHGLALSRFDGVYAQLIPARQRKADAMNRLILEVQAEMPCYQVRADHDYQRFIPETCLTPRPYAVSAMMTMGWAWGKYEVQGRRNCPSCEAREQLKEKDEAPTHVT